MKSHYWDEKLMIEDGANPTILAIGDSWFWYLFLGGSLTNNLGDLVKAKGNVILAKGMNGAEASDYVVEGKYAELVRETLRLYGSGLQAVFLSGGGNDFAGFKDLRPMLKDNCSGETTPEGCFRGGKNGLKGFLDRMDGYYRTLIGMVYTRTSLNCLILMHSYDYAIPNGKGVFGKEAWVRPALLAAGVPANLHRKCVVHLIDSFHDMLTKITEDDPAHLFVVNSRGTLGKDDWANELHPNGGGFKKIVKERWKPVLETLRLA